MTKPFAVLASLLAVALVPGFALADPTNGGEASNTANGAQTVAPGAYSGTLATASDVDWYRVSVPTATQSAVTLSCSGSMTLQLYQGDGATLISSASCGGGVSCTSTFNYIVYAKVSGTAMGSYSFTVSNGASSIPPTTICNF